MPTFPDESRSELPSQRPAELPVLPAEPDQERQRKRMLIALGVLLAALLAVVVKDWDFWFPPTRGEGETSISTAKKKVTAAPVTPVVSEAPASREHAKSGKSSETAAAPFAATTERAALPPLQVEVVAGNRHVPVAAKSPAIHVDVGAETGIAGAKNAGAAPETAASPDGVRLSPQAAQSVSVSVPPDYPLLARQMKVQGGVSMQALISKEGTIQELQVLNGPGILATAAREAVKQWRFKPYLQNGQPIETQARITVNFTISTN